MKHLLIDIDQQRLTVYNNHSLMQSYPVSTAKNGAGELKDSGQTPRGLHQVIAIIGRNMPENSVFVARRPTGEIYSETLSQRYPDRDWILSRILWLSGKENGKNRHGKVDTLSRYIYIHGTPPTEPVGVPLSHGCIRMRNSDVIELSEMVEPGVSVLIKG